MPSPAGILPAGVAESSADADRAGAGEASKEPGPGSVGFGLQEESRCVTPSGSPLDRPAFARPANAPPAFHLLAKPTGAQCNLDCSYCYFLDKEQLYPGSPFRMSERTLEAYLRQLIESHQTDTVNIAWQGGEPTLMGLDFYRTALALAERYRRPGMTFVHTLQTNGTLLDDDWAAFFKEHGFLIGISLDGPRRLHDVNRVDKGGQPTFDRVMRGLRLLQKHGVEFNVLTAVNRVNADYPFEVYRFLRDEAGATWMQFIPVVERLNPDGSTLRQEGSTVSERSVRPEQYGQFLSSVFDEWVRHDVGRVYVQTFEATLRNWLGMESSGMCIFNSTCGTGLALEHNGDLYACDHFVEPAYRQGNVHETHMLELVASPRQIQFGEAKRSALPRQCRQCEVRFACHGECPKNRFLLSQEGEPGLNYLCEGYLAFFRYAAFAMKLMAGLLRRGREAREVMDVLERTFAAVHRNDPCPCGSGLKFRRCHGRARIDRASLPLPAPQGRAAAGRGDGRHGPPAGAARA